MGVIKVFIRRYAINVSISLISLVIFSVIGYYIYGYVKSPSDQAPYHGVDNEYLLSFYNQMGQKIGSAEGGLKLMMDPFSIYTNYPNQKSRSYSINEHGFRDSFVNNNHSVIMLIGSSAAFGFALKDNNKTFASIINRYSESYEVINTAVVGFLSGQELSKMIHYLDNFKPSMYIVFDGWNDIYDPYVFAKEWPVQYGPIGYNNAFFMIEGRLADYVQLMMKEKASEIPSIKSPNEPLSESEYSHRIISTYIANISKMNSFATARGAKFLIVLQPELGNKKIISENEQEILNTWGSKYGYFERRISKRYKELISEATKSFQERSIPYIDINDEPEFTENSKTLFFDVIHPNELGHEVIARIIHRTLLEKF
jgi:GDSL-like Lipase/Acylhydrolase